MRALHDNSSEELDSDSDEPHLKNASSDAAQLDGEQRTMKKEEMVCQCMSSRGRNLVVCIDGTSNQFGTQVGLVICLELHMS